MATQLRYSALLIPLFACPITVQAKSLTEQIDTIFGSNGIEISNENHTAHFSSDSLAALGTLTEQLATSSVDIPAISTVPGLTYSYNPNLQAFERRPGSIGSIYIERPLTIGKGKLDIGFSYNYVDFDSLDGQNLNGLSFLGLKHNDCCEGDNEFEHATADVIFDKFSLQSHIFNFSTTYGITDKWDVNILVPVIQTELDISARAQIHDTSENFHNFPGGSKTETKSVSDNNLGVGDILLRTKYHFLSYQQFNMAGGINLRLPSGSVEEFQGVGDTTVTPYLSFSHEISIVDLHATVGVEFNSGNDKRDRIRYAGGATFNVTPNFGLITDFIGTSNIRTNEVLVTVPTFSGRDSENNIPTGTDTITSIVHNDTLDLALGFKFIPAKSVAGFFNVFIPLNNQGLRSDLIPTGGVNVAF